MQLSILRGANKWRERTVMSKKMRWFLVSRFGDGALDYMRTMDAYQEAYLNARTFENINRITTLECERLVRNGLNLGLRQKERTAL